MLLELILALIVGVLAGTFTGLFPGIHINLVATGLMASLGYFAGIEGIVLVVFIVAMAITHTFIDFIPSVFLGAPEEDSFLAVLPGHQLLKEGKGYEAVVLTLYGSLIALPIILIFTFIFVYFLEDFFSLIRNFIPYILLFISFYLIFREEEFLISLTVFLFSGFLGLLTFNLPVKEPLLPLLSGMFGVSGLVVSMRKKFTIPKQKITKLKKIKLSRKSFFKSVFAFSIAAPLCSFLPGIGSGHAAVASSEISGDTGEDPRSFLFSVGAINTIVMALSFVTLYSIGRTRSGAAVAVEKILKQISSQDLFIIIVVIFLSGVSAFVVGIYLSKFFARNINRISYWKISLVILFILFLVNFILSNFLGLIVLATGSALGIYCILSGARRINLMGSLLLPAIIFYLA